MSTDNEQSEYILDQDVVRALLRQKITRQIRSQERCVTLVNTFVDIIQTKGLLNIEPDYVARKAGYTRTSMYRYFCGIEGLLSFAVQVILLMPAESYTAMHLKILLLGEHLMCEEHVPVQPDCVEEFRCEYIARLDDKDLQSQIKHSRLELIK
ncbi:hypothetical protein [Edwardsiella tarda]|uniref:hypothetical protein n=1 Tax=Edwardsiella tarda TaxID=636 RepID=UPI00030877D9|nr:hypothetical protein [Edwardsiella tarda]